MAGTNKLSDGNNLQIAEKMLYDVTKVFESTGTNYWLEGGTLIGIVREQRLLPWDNDMDISMLDTSKLKLFLIVPILMLKGYRITLQNHQADIGPFKKGQLKIVKIRNFAPGFKKGQVTLDIFLKRQVNGDCFWVVGIDKRVLKSTPAHLTNSQTSWKFKAKDYLIPKEYNGYLSFRYGDWQTPQKEWDFRTDDQAIVKRDYPLEEA